MDALLLLPFLAIEINIDPTITEIGPFTLTWHGLFTAIGIVAGVTLAVWLGKRDGIPPEIGQEVALVGVPAAIVGARLFFVAEHWDQFQDDLPSIVFGITEGGITLYGALIGGSVAGVLYGLYHRWPIGIGLDAAAPGMILGQGIGRIGDLINGEHLATHTDLPWAVKYTHPNTLGEIGVSVHPTAGGYELIGDFLILAFLLLVARRYFRVPGWTYCSYMILYAATRFVWSEFRMDEQTIGDIPIPQIVSAIVVGLAIILAGVFLRYPGPITPEWEQRVFGEATDADGESGEAEAAPA
ncbi:MAG: prolipoprotein diacylglyceryl transferase [Dehalococcoidia bacterium]